MKWILIGFIANSYIHSEHDTKEACLGRVEILKEQKVQAKCVELPTTSATILTYPGQGSIQLCNNGACTTR